MFRCGCIMLFATSLIFIGATTSGEKSEQIREPKCLETDYEIQQALVSTTPPLVNMTTVNSLNISRAVYPSVTFPSQYIKIWIYFLNRNQTAIEYNKTMKFTWSQACLYVATKYVSLESMQYFSLGTILVRSRTDLHITLPPFCEHVYTKKDIKEKLEYFMATLQDLAVIPSITDPSLNTAECVLQGHDGDKEQPLMNFETTSLILYNSCSWLVLVTTFISFLVIYALTCMFKNKTIPPSDNNKKWDKRECSIIVVSAIFILGNFAILGLSFKYFVADVHLGYLITFCLLPIFTLVCLVICKRYNDRNFQHAFMCFLIPLCLLLPILTLVFCKYFENNNFAKKLRKQLMTVILLFAEFYLVHHFIWIAIGISTSFLWAVPIFLVICIMLLTIAYIVFFWKEHFQSICHPLNWIISGILLSTILFAMIVIFSSRVQITGSLNALAQSSLYSILLWCGQHFFIKGDKSQTNSSSVQSDETPTSQSGVDERPLAAL